MNKSLNIVFFFLLVFNLNTKLQAQDSCLTALPLCTGSVYDFDSSTGIPGPGGPDYGCLSSVANCLWFSIEAGTSGSITVTGAGTDGSGGPIDIDFVYWGPFSSLSGVCYAQLDAGHVLGCDYSGSNLINIAIPSATAGSYYIAMVSNYSDAAGDINYSQTGGTAITACGLACTFTGLTAIPTPCDTTNNKYSVSGAVNFVNAPATGTLTIFGSCGGSQSFNAPFTSPINYSLTGLTSNGSTCIVAVGFSDDGSCSMNKSYTAPVACNTTSISEKANELGVILSPNPSTEGIFDLTFESAVQNISISVSDVSGRNVYKETLLKYSGVYKKQIDLSSLNKGIYFVKVEGEKGYSVKKVVFD